MGNDPISMTAVAAYFGRMREALYVCRVTLDEDAPRLSSEEHARALAQVHEVETRVGEALRAACAAVERWRAGQLTDKALVVYLDEPARILFDIACGAGHEVARA